MTSPAAVGSAWVILRATSDKVKEDIRKAMQAGWKDNEKEALAAGRRAGKRYGTGFKAGVESTRITDFINGTLNALEREAGLSGARSGRRYAEAYQRELQRANVNLPGSGNNSRPAATPSTSSGINYAEIDRANRERERQAAAQEANRQRIQQGIDRANQRRDADEVRRQREAERQEAQRVANVQRIQRNVERGNQRRDSGREATRRDQIVRVRTVLDDTATKVLRVALTSIMGMLRSIIMLSAAATAALAGQAALSGLLGILGTLTQIGGVLLTLPALAVAFAAPLATAVIGANGLKEAFQAMKQQGEGAKETAKAVAAAQERVVSAEEHLESAHDGVARAEKGVERAARDHERAREGVALAIKQVTERMQDLNLELKGLALDEEDALIGVARAEERLRNLPPGSTALDRREAINDLKKAKLRVDEVREANEDVRTEAKQAAEEGVEGSREVRDARQAEADAAENVEEANKALVQAHKEVAKAQREVAKAMQEVIDAANSGPVDKFAKAMEKLAPAAQSFVLAMKALGPQWTEFRKSIQQNLFAGLDESVTRLATVQLPVLKEGLGAIATTMNGVLKDVIGAFSTPDAIEKWRLVLQRINGALEIARPGILALVGAFKNLVTVGSEFLGRFAKGFTNSAQSFEKWTSNFDHIRKLINGGIDAAKLFWELLKNLGGSLKAIMDAGKDSGFTETFVALTGRMEDFLESVEGKTALTQFFENGRIAMQAIAPVLKEIFLGIVAITGLLAGLGKDISPGLVDFFKGFRGALENLKPAFETIGPKIKELFSALGEILPQLGQTVGKLIQDFSPWIDILTILTKTLLPVVLSLIEFLSPALSAMAPVIVGLAAAWKLLGLAVKFQEMWSRRAAAATFLQAAASRIAAAATRAWAVIQLAFNAVMTANPIALVILGLVALGAAIVVAYKKSETFRNVVQAVWEAIKVAAVFVWENVVKPMFNDMITTFKFVGEIFMWVWENLIKPSWNAFLVFVRFVWDNLLQPLFNEIRERWIFVGQVFMWAWENVIKPGWDIFVSVLKWMWEQVIQPTFNLIREGWGFVADAFKWVWENILKPNWEFFTSALSWSWDNIIKPTWENIKEGLRLLGEFFGFVWNELIKPWWNALGEGLNWVWENVIKKTFDGIKTGLEFLKDAFDTVVKGIGSIWNGMKDIIKAPLKFFVDVVYNKGIRTGWNAIAGLIGAKEMPELKVEGLASGGMVDGRKFPFQDQTYGVMSGYSPGRDDRLIAVGGGEPVLRPEVGRVVGRDWVNGVNAAARTGGVGGVRRFMREAYADGGVVESMRRFVATNSPGMQLTSGLRFTDNGYHSKGMAADFSDGTSDTPGMQRLANIIANTFGPPKTLQLIHHPFNRNIGQGVGWVGDGMGFYGAGTMLEHQNHVHWASDGPVDDRPGDDKSVFGQIGDFFSGLAGKGAAALFDLQMAPTELALRGLSKALNGNESPFGRMPMDLYTHIKKVVRDYIVGKDGESRNVLGAGSAMPSPGAGPVMDQVKEAMMPYGWHEGPEWEALQKLVQGESSWNPSARNPSSGAYGLFQFLGSTKDAYLPDENPNPRIQGAAGARYIKDRYGSPSNAYRFWLSQNPHWYDSGGWLKRGLTLVNNETDGPEAVLTGQQWDWVKNGLDFNGANKWFADQDFGSQLTGIGIDALKETLGGFTDLVGLQKPVDMLIDLAAQAAKDAVSGMAIEPNKMADTMIFNGMDPMKVQEELQRTLQQSMTPSSGRYRGSN